MDLPQILRGADSRQNAVRRQTRPAGERSGYAFSSPFWGFLRKAILRKAFLKI